MFLNFLRLLSGFFIVFAVCMIKMCCTTFNFHAILSPALLDCAGLGDTSFLSWLSFS